MGFERSGFYGLSFSNDAVEGMQPHHLGTVRIMLMFAHTEQTTFTRGR